MGKITDEEKALKQCTCYKLNPWGNDDPQNLMCYSKGVSGGLNRRQEQKCKEIKIMPTSRKLRRHFEKFNEIGTILKVCLKDENGETTEAFYKCIEDEASSLTSKKDKKGKKEETDE